MNSSLCYEKENGLPLVKTLLYKVVSENLDRLSLKVEMSNKELILANVRNELQQYEDSLAKKTVKALQRMNQKLQKEITDFINLKMRIAFFKSGVHQAVDQNVLESAEVFFHDLEDNIILSLDELEAVSEKQQQSMKTTGTTVQTTNMLFTADLKNPHTHKTPQKR
jgi:hypothetical protein